MATIVCDTQTHGRRNNDFKLKRSRSGTNLKARDTSLDSDQSCHKKKFFQPSKHGVKTQRLQKKLVVK